MDPEQFQPKVLVIGRRNRHRSQMLEGLLRRELNRFGVVSAGLRPAEAIDELAVRVMDEIDVDIGSQQTRSLGQLIDERLQMLIYVSSDVKREAPVIAVSCPERVLDLPDPRDASSTDAPLDTFRKLRKVMVEEVVPGIRSDLQPGGDPS